MEEIGSPTYGDFDIAYIILYVILAAVPLLVQKFSSERIRRKLILLSVLAHFVLAILFLNPLDFAMSFFKQNDSSNYLVESQEIPDKNKMNIDELEDMVDTPKNMEVVDSSKDVSSLDYVLDIDNSRVGSFKIGQKIPQEFPSGFILTEQIEYGQEASEIKTFVVSEDGEKLFIIYPDYDLSEYEFNDVINSIVIVSSRIKTNRGPSVGSQVSSFIDRFSDYEIWYSYISGMYVINSKQIDAQYLLDGNDYKGEDDNASSDYVILKYKDFASNSKIIGIRLFSH